MGLSVEVWKVNDTRRCYLTVDAELTTQQPYINWARAEGSPAVEQQLDEKDENFGIALFAIEAVIGVIVAPKYLEIFINDPSKWPGTESAILSALAQHTGSETVEPFSSPQN